jgi:hypothetical protein
MFGSSVPNCRADHSIYTFIIAVLRNPDTLFQNKTELCVPILITQNPPWKISQTERGGFKSKPDWAELHGKTVAEVHKDHWSEIRTDNGRNSEVLRSLDTSSYNSLKGYGNVKYKKFWEEVIAYFPWYDTDRIENDAFNNSSIVAVYLLPR